MTVDIHTILTQADQVNDHLLRLAVDCMDDWFPDDQIPTEDFIDRLCDNYLQAEGFDIESYDCPAVRKLMRHARQAKRELA